MAKIWQIRTLVRSLHNFSLKIHLNVEAVLCVWVMLFRSCSLPRREAFKKVTAGCVNASSWPLEEIITFLIRRKTTFFCILFLFRSSCGWERMLQKCWADKRTHIKAFYFQHATRSAALSFSEAALCPPAQQHTSCVCATSSCKSFTPKMLGGNIQTTEMTSFIFVFVFFGHVSKIVFV